MTVESLKVRLSGMRGGGMILAIALALFTCAIGAGLARAQVAEVKGAPTTILIFDGSGSMWGKMEGERQIKLAMARDAVKLALGKLPVDAFMASTVNKG